MFGCNEKCDKMKSAIRFKMTEFLKQRRRGQTHPPAKDFRDKKASPNREVNINWSKKGNLLLFSGRIGYIPGYFLISAYLGQFRFSFCLKMGGAGGIGFNRGAFGTTY